MSSATQTNAIFQRVDNMIIFRQFGVKIDMNGVSQEAYFTWLDRITLHIGKLVSGAKLVEKTDARTAPPLNTAVYYDTQDYDLLETGALLRTSCNKITHAFCAFKEAQDEQGVRKDHRYVFQGAEKKLIQNDPTGPTAAALVQHLLQRRMELTTGHYFRREFPHLQPNQISPVLVVDNSRFGFFVWLDRKDALRCSLDRASVRGLRHPDRIGNFAEVELAIYPRLSSEVAQDPRVHDLVQVLKASLLETFEVKETTEIKYQRAANLLGLR